MGTGAASVEAIGLDESSRATDTSSIGTSEITPSGKSMGSCTMIRPRSILARKARMRSGYHAACVRAVFGHKENRVYRPGQ